MSISHWSLVDLSASTSRFRIQPYQNEFDWIQNTSISKILTLKALIYILSPNIFTIFGTIGDTWISKMVDGVPIEVEIEMSNRRKSREKMMVVISKNVYVMK